MRLVIEEDAEADADQVAAFYDRMDPGCGAYFLQRMRESAMELLHNTDALITRFPVAMYYRVAPDIVRICAVLDCRIDPRTIRKILRTR